MQAFGKRLLVAGTTGYIIFCFSESFFWTRPTESHLWGYIVGWLLYSLLTFTVFTIINHFKVNTVWALFLAGAVFGWLTEGVIVQTMYDSLPWQLSFTGLSWHSMITVLIGWFYTRKTFFENNIRKTFLLTVGLGLFYGIWSLNSWVLDEPVITPIPTYALFVSISTLLLLISYILCDQITIATFQPTRLEITLLAAFFTVYFLIVTIPTQPLAIFILPPLLLLTFLTLRKNQQTEMRPNMIVLLYGRPSWWNYALLLTIPLVTISIYALAFNSGLTQYPDIISLIPIGFYVITTLLGAGLYGLSVVKIWLHPSNLINETISEPIIE